MKKAPIVALMLLATAAFVGAGAAEAAMGHGKETAKVKLSPVPNVKTKGGGEADFTLGKDGTTLHYVLHVKNLENATMAHIHEASEAGAPGAVLVWLYPTTGEAPSLKEGNYSGLLAEGDIDAGKLGGPMKGGTVKDLFEKIEYGKAGVAVHTKENPGGELWGYHKVKTHEKKM